MNIFNNVYCPQSFKVLVENCVIYIIGKYDDSSSSFSNPSTIQKKRHSSAIEGRNKILKIEKTFKSGNSFKIKFLKLTVLK